MLQNNMSKLEYRIGSSYDVHAFEEKKNSFIVVGGQKINCNYKLIAHSDGDVVFHALSEALLGSLALGDLGLHFPVNDHRYDNYDSSKILIYCYNLVKEKGYVINNIDISIILESIKLKPYIESVRKNIATILQIDEDQISIKAMTNEKLDDLGNNKGISSFATVLIKLK
jgi:2-C-methyl-D-erythritol 2,4-cyclodiphosphate synthase